MLSPKGIELELPKLIDQATGVLNEIPLSFPVRIEKFRRKDGGERSLRSVENQRGLRARSFLG